MLLEIVILIVVGKAIGPLWTIGLLLLFVLIGAFLVRRESGRTWKALRQAVDTGKMPGRELADASLVLMGGLLLLLPGFLSDLVGLFLILPFTRSVSRRLLGVLIGAKMPAGVVPGTGGSRRTPGSAAGGAGTWGTSRPGAAHGGTAHGGTARGEDIIEGEIVSEDPPPER